jgi:hypothetical protein
LILANDIHAIYQLDDTNNQIILSGHFVIVIDIASKKWKKNKMSLASNRAIVDDFFL